jgi:hypothetical protein
VNPPPSRLPSRAQLLAGCALLLALASPLRAREPIALTIDFQVVRVDGGQVVADEFVPERIASANRIYEPYGVRFVQGSMLDLAAAHAALESAADRDALGAKVRARVINCFVVRSLRDVDEPERMRRGVHWHSRTYPGAHYVILSSIAGPDVLAHELGHYLGNPKHSETAGNLMSYQRGDVSLPFLDDAQIRRMERTIRGYLKSGELRKAR